MDWPFIVPGGSVTGTTVAAIRGRGLRAFTLAASIPWAITPEALSVILRLAARDELTREDVAAAMAASPEALAARLGRPLDNAHATTMHGNVAVIPVNGPIFRYASLFSEISGATSAEVLARDLRAALDDPSVQGILLEVDSPGGEVSGIAELAGMIRAADAVKPVHAYVDDFGASAAYWLSSASGHITVAPTARVGSIGVVSAYPDPTKTASKEIEFVSSKSPKKRPDVTTEAGRTQIQQTVDDLADVFIAHVARYRGVSTDTVEADFGQGGVFVGQGAVNAGLVDAIGTFEEALAGVAGAATRRGGAPAQPRQAALSIMADQEDVTMPDTQPQPTTENGAPAPIPAPTPTPSPTGAITDAALAERMTAMEAELRAAKALTESQATALQKLTDQNKAMAADARRKRFTDEVLGRSDASGVRWFGEPEKHVAMLEHLADSAGEDSALFTGYVTQQRALAEQMRSSKLFGELGSGHGDATGGDVVAKMTAMANKRVADGQAKSFGEAIGQIEREDGALFRQYQAEMRAGSRRSRAE
jgi:signal peptide peptidase SppA